MRTFAEGARRGAPGAVQVADRWHLYRNLTDAVERALFARLSILKKAAEIVATAEPGPAIDTKPDNSLDLTVRVPTQAERIKSMNRERRLARYNEVIELRRRGVPKRTIAKQTGLSRQTVHRWVSADSFPERQERPPVQGKLGAYLDHVDQRIQALATNATELWREIRELGYTGGQTMVRDYVRSVRVSAPRRPAAPASRPSPRKSAWMLVLPAEKLDIEQRAYVEALCDISPEIARIRELALGFREVFREKNLSAFDAWLRAAEDGPLRRFAAGLAVDIDAVRAAIILPWSNGPTEGQINRLKLLKRQMYGRAGFDLLRARVLHAA